MKTLAISIVAGAALSSAMAVSASAMPMSNLAAAASNLAPNESVRYVRKHYRYRGTETALVAIPAMQRTAATAMDPAPTAIRKGSS
jgi:hypothetical protein